jgi:hypothetical protein
MFETTLVLVGFVVDKVATRQGFLRAGPFLPVSVILPTLDIHPFIYRRRIIFIAIDSIVE